MTFSLVLTHLGVFFKAFDKRLCQTPLGEPRSVYQQALPCPLADVLLQGICIMSSSHKHLGPYCGPYVDVFVYEIFCFFFQNAYRFV